LSHRPAWPDETVGQLRFTGILVTGRVSEGRDSLPRLRVGLPFRQASLSLGCATNSSL